MQSFIVSGKDKVLRAKRIQSLCNEFEINAFDIESIEPEMSVGIELVRKIQERIYLKPLQGDKKALVIPQADSITVEAQNALLKLLEEPPPSSIIILGVSKSDVLLPTIQSRCKIIQIEKISKPNGDERSNYSKLLSSILESGVGERLKYAQDVSKSREDAALFLEQLILAARSKLMNDPESEVKLVELIKKLQKTLTEIKTTNASVRLALESVLLNL